MTLYRQIILWLLLVFVLLLVSVFSVQIHNTRSYLLNQQTIETDNAVNAAGLALTPYLAENDLIGAESVINAMFDGSFYQRVSLKIVTPQSQILREYPPGAFAVPGFFRRWLPIDPQTRSVTLTSGWMQTAELSVTSNPAVAYQQLWQSAIQLFLALSAILGLGAAALLLGLNLIVRKPLNRLRTIAQAISRHDFGAPLPLPATKELHDVVDAFNQMNRQIRHHFRQQAEEADRLRIQAYQDPVSGLANRRFLLSKLSALIQDKGHGGIVLLRADIIKDTYQQQGFRAGDSLVSAISRQLTTLFAPKATLGRLNQSEFLYIGPAQSRTDLTEIARRMLDITDKCHPVQEGVAEHNSCVAVVMKEKMHSVSDLLAAADNAVNQASTQADLPLCVTGDDTSLPTFGRQQWQSLIAQAIKSDQLTFSFQTAIDHKHQPLFREVFTSVEHQGQAYRAQFFLHALDRLEEGASLDRYVLSKMAKHLGYRDDTSLVPLTVNLSLSSIRTAGFLRWLAGFMAMHRHLSSKLLLEIPEAAFVQHFEFTSLLCNIIRHYGFRFGIDNYGHHFSTLGYLQRFKPYYVKLDYAYTCQLDQDIKTDVLRAVTRTADNQNILTIATRVETQAQMNTLAALSVRGFQGYVVDSLLRASP